MITLAIVTVVVAALVVAYWIRGSSRSALSIADSLDRADALGLPQVRQKFREQIGDVEYARFMTRVNRLRGK